MAEAVDQLRDLVIRTRDEVSTVEAVALTSGTADSWVKQAFTMRRESQSAIFPGGFEMLLAPGSFVAAVVHAPVGTSSGIPVPLGFASFDTRVVNRGMALLEGAAAPFGLGDVLRKELQPISAELPKS